jgi:hypothetical protein
MGSVTTYACRGTLTLRTKVHYHLTYSNDPDSSLLGSRYLVCNSPDGRSGHSRNRRPVHHGFQHQSHPRWDADTERAFSRTAMRGVGTDSYDDDQDGCENRAGGPGLKRVCPTSRRDVGVLQDAGCPILCESKGWESTPLNKGKLKNQKRRKAPPGRSRGLIGGPQNTRGSCSGVIFSPRNRALPQATTSLP